MAALVDVRPFQIWSAAKHDLRSAAAIERRKTVAVLVRAARALMREVPA
jgi:hypothetical protein